MVYEPTGRRAGSGAAVALHTPLEPRAGRVTAPGRYLVTVNRGARSDDPGAVFTRHGGYDRATAPRA